MSKDYKHELAMNVYNVILSGDGCFFLAVDIDDALNEAKVYAEENGFDVEGVTEMGPIDNPVWASIWASKKFQADAIKTAKGEK